MLRELRFENTQPKMFWEKYHKSKLSVVTANPEIILLSYKDKEILKYLKLADIITVDGIGLKLALKFFGQKFNKCTGIDLVNELVLGGYKLKVYLWGATEDVVSEATNKFKSRGMNIIGYHNGFASDESSVLDEIKRLKADVVLVGMPATKSIPLVLKIKSHTASTAITIGGVLDIYAGKARRAPKLFQKLGLEWFWRLVTQPSRLKRLPNLFIFIYEVVKERIKHGKI